MTVLDGENTRDSKIRSFEKNPVRNGNAFIENNERAKGNPIVGMDFAN
jgi:hypothetical protein